MKNIKMTLALFLVLSLVILANLMNYQVHAEESVNIAIDGNKVTFTDVPPFIDQNGRTMIPVRAVSEKLGAEVGWIPESQTVTVDLNGKHIELKIGSNEVFVDGEKQIIDTEAKIIDGRTVVPLRFVSESLGYLVEWFGETRTVSITLDGITDQLQLVRENDGSVKFENLKTEEIIDVANYVSTTSDGTVTFRGDTVAKVDESHFPVKMNTCTFEGVWMIPEYDLFVIEVTPEHGEGYFGYSEISMIMTLKDGSKREYKTPAYTEKANLSKQPLLSNNFSNIATWEDSGFADGETFTTFFSTQFWPGFPIEDVVKIALISDNLEDGNVIEINTVDIPVIK